ncbi:DUF6712 family protein [Arsenicibacter rosenii]|uniref:Uncharacterized protein n=1 Tax=Arsenicibacter rosenii TaxID=1750698 RepID=A0A1S2VQW6_9BACT|nr:DUF6712 family protein [Arsenicibacter rosenii]OIN61169.1 hypothetical protein BLX24_03670 [Arsenicibacter rosenii]
MLINTLPVLKSLLGGIQKKTTWDTWAPFVRQAELDHIVPAIGEELYDHLLTKINAATDVVTATPLEETLIERIRIALCHFVEMDSELAIMLQKGDLGVAVASPPNMQAPGKWAIVARIKEARDKADRSLERVLQYLEKHVGSFPVWVNSNAYTVSHSLFLATATEYTEYFGAVQNSRRLYVALRPYIIKAENDLIRPLIGESFYTYLKGKLPDRTYSWTAQESEALKMIRSAVANDAFSRAVTFININADLRYLSETDGIVNEDVLPENRRAEIKAECNREARNETMKLKKYLDHKASPTVFPAYYQSDAYTVSEKKPYRLPANNDPQQPFVL